MESHHDFCLIFITNRPRHSSHPDNNDNLRFAADASKLKSSGESIRHSKSTGNLSMISNENGREKGGSRVRRAPTLRQQKTRILEGKPLKVLWNMKEKLENLEHQQDNRQWILSMFQVGRVRADDDTDRSDQTSQVTISRGAPSIMSSFSMSFDRRCR